METTVRENNRITKMEKSVEEIKTDVSEIKSALIGNTLSGERGVVGQVGSLKTEIEYLKKDIEVLQTENTKNEVIIRQLKYVTGLVVAGLILGFIKILL